MGVRNNDSREKNTLLAKNSIRKFIFIVSPYSKAVKKEATKIKRRKKQPNKNVDDYNVSRMCFYADQ
jgi:hypothetical protein